MTKTCQEENAFIYCDHPVQTSGNIRENFTTDN